MSGSGASSTRLLNELPRMYLAYCRAASQLDDGARIVGDFIRVCRVNSLSVPPEPERDTARGDLKRALGLTSLIARLGWGWLLDALESALEGSRVERSWDAVSVIEEQTDRWQRYGGDEARDLVLLVKGADRVVSLSSAEVVEDVDGSSVALVSYRLEHVHYFPAFNRMRPVRGRRVEIQTLQDPESYREAVASFKPLLRTVRDARRVGESRTIREFTPVGRPDGVRLWAFSALLGRFGPPRPIPAPAAGAYPEVYFPFSDGTDEVALVFHPEVFRRCLQDFAALNFRSPIHDFGDLQTLEAPSLVVIGWPFGSSQLTGPLDHPTVVHWFPLSADSKASSYEILTRVVSARKIRSAAMDSERPGWRVLLERPDVIEVAGWVYYVPAGLDPRLFRSYVETGFRGLDYLTAHSQFGVDMKQVTDFIQGYQRFFGCSPQDKRIYLSADPAKEAADLYPKLEPSAPPILDFAANQRIETREPGGEGAPVDDSSFELRPDQILVRGLILTRQGEEYVRVVSRKKEATASGKLKIKEVASYDLRASILTITKEVWPSGGPESARVATVLSRSKARIEAAGA
jgi:hypothetical protein